MGKDKLIIEIRTYLVEWAKRFSGKPLHLIDLGHHLDKIASFNERLEDFA